MVVPYGSPKRGLWRKSVFDTGEAGFGKSVNELELGCGALHCRPHLFVRGGRCNRLHRRRTSYAPSAAGWQTA